MKRKVLVLAGYYFPGVMGGGPIQSLKNLVDNLSDQLDFYIVADDRDLGDQQPYKDIKTQQWVPVGKAQVFYTKTEELTFRSLTRLLNNLDYDILYLNSFFSYKISMAIMLLNKLKRISPKPILLAPRGQFSPGALGLKPRAKQLYITLAKALGLYKGITWHATAVTEQQDIEALFGGKVKIKVVSNLTADYRGLTYAKELVKKPGALKIVFISRIHPKKNLKQALASLQGLDGQVKFNIYGPLEDKKYWAECEQVIKSLPQKVDVEYSGLVAHEEIMGVFLQNHVFLFPTLGENFGHVISEALIGGCPVILSDQTPWRGLEKLNVGWDIALSDPDKFRQVLQQCLDLTQEDYQALAKKAFDYGKKHSNRPEDLRKAYELFGIRS